MVRGGYILDENNNPVHIEDTLEWGKSFENKNRIVKQEHVGDVYISTVFLGLDHRFDEDGPPILFETMIFGGKHDQYQERYCTWDEADIGHRDAVRMVKNIELLENED